MQIDLALDNSTFITNPFDAAIQELDLLLTTPNTEMLGNPDYGVNMEQFLWELTPSPEAVESYLTEKIIQNTYWCNRLNVKVDVSTVQGTVRNIYVVKITLNVPGTQQTKSKTYQFR